MSNPRPLVMCGPSGAGKSTLTKKLLEEFGDHIGFSISHTTRAPRVGEVEGEHYYFVDKDTMLESIRKGDFLETAEYSGNMYGTSKRVVKAIQEQGKVCLLEIDTQGVRQVKQMTDFNPLYVFVKPPSMDDLEERLRARGTETEESLQTRLAAARHEIEYGEQPGNFDTVIVNDDFPRAYKQLRTAVMPLFADLMSDK